VTNVESLVGVGLGVLDHDLILAISGEGVQETTSQDAVNDLTVETHAQIDVEISTGRSDRSQDGLAVDDQAGEFTSSAALSEVLSNSLSDAVGVDHRVLNALRLESLDDLWIIETLAESEAGHTEITLLRSRRASKLWGELRSGDLYIVVVIEDGGHGLSESVAGLTDEVVAYVG